MVIVDIHILMLFQRVIQLWKNGHGCDHSVRIDKADPGVHGWCTLILNESSSIDAKYVPSWEKIALLNQDVSVTHE